MSSVSCKIQYKLNSNYNITLAFPILTLCFCAWEYMPKFCLWSAYRLHIGCDALWVTNSPLATDEKHHSLSESPVIYHSMSK